MIPVLRKFGHEERVEIGEQICSRILDKYQEAVLAVFIYGSVAKKLDRPYSDLEITTVVRDGVDIPEKYYLYRGLIIEIDYTQESNMLKGARRLNQSWPTEADHYRNRIVLYERDAWLERLKQAVADNDKADFTPAIRAAAVAVTESLASLRNARLANDEIGMRTRALFLAGDAAQLVYLLNRRYVLTTSWFWKQVFECPKLPRNFQNLARISAGFTQAPLDKVVEAAEELFAEVQKMVRSHGISIESEEFLV